MQQQVRSLTPDSTLLSGSEVEDNGARAGPKCAPFQKDDGISFLHIEAVCLRLELLAIDDEELVVV